MKKSKFVLVSVFVLIIAVALLILAVQVNAQNQSVEDLTERLKQQGVPVKSITVQSRIPFQIEIVLQSSSDGKNTTLDDLWFAQLARREASLAHRIGVKVDSYRLTFVNTKGEIVTWEQNFLHPSDPSQQSFSSTPSKLDDTATKKAIAERLNLSGMTLDQLDVSSSVLRGDSRQIVTLQLSVPDLESANKALPSFLLSLRPLLDDINAKQGTRIAICRMRLVDRQGRVLLNYIWDLETREETSSSVSGLIQWYPRPRPLSSTPYPGP